MKCEIFFCYKDIVPLVDEVEIKSVDYTIVVYQYIFSDFDSFTMELLDNFFFKKISIVPIDMFTNKRVLPTGN